MTADTTRDRASRGYRRFVRGMHVEDIRTGEIAEVARTNRPIDTAVHVTFISADTGKRTWEEWPVEFLSTAIERAT